MKTKFRILAVLLALVIGGCAGASPVDKPTAEDPFPPDRFLTAEGAGASEAEARRAAMAELAAIFESRVYARTLQQATAWIGEGLTEQFDKAVEQTVHIQTDVQLEGARIGRTWPEPSMDGFRALAVLDRLQAASRWQRELEGVQMLVAGQVQALDTVKGRLSRLVALNRISTGLVREAVIESRLSVLGRPAMPISQDYSDIVAQREALSHDIALLVRIAGEPAPAFTQRITSQLTQDGYRIAADLDQAAGLITGTISVQALDLGNPDVRFVRAIANVQLVDTDTGVRIAAFDEAVRKGHVNEGEAARRAIQGAAQRVTRQLVHALATLGVAAGKDQPYGP